VVVEVVVVVDVVVVVVEVLVLVAVVEIDEGVVGVNATELDEDIKLKLGEVVSIAENSLELISEKISLESDSDGSVI